MRGTVFALALPACCSAPAAGVRPAPAIPTTDREVWRCEAPGAPGVRVEGTGRPARVEVGGAVLDCRLVLLP